MAVTMLPPRVHETPSGSRRALVMVSVKLARPSFLVSARCVTAPAEKERETLAERRSTIAMALFSCRVTTAWSNWLMSTNSGSGSLGNRVPLRFDKFTLRTV